MDRAIQRKSKTYVWEEVLTGRADWVDPNDQRKGIICREMLYFGEKRIEVETVSVSDCIGGELPGLRFVPPNGVRNPLIPRLLTKNLPTAAPGWDWSHEAIAQTA